MLRLSASDEYFYPTKTIPPNPPLTSFIEQCFWGESSQKHYYVNKYNDRCASRASLRSSEQFLHKLRSSASQKKFDCSKKYDSFQIVSSSTLSNDIDDDNEVLSSRCSTPEFIQEVYNAYSNFENKNLLRRPVSQCSKRLQIEPNLIAIPNNNGPAPADDCSNQDVLLDLPFKKPFKVSIDLPTCEMTDNSDAMSYHNTVSTSTATDYAAEDSKGIENFDNNKNSTNKRINTPLRKRLKKKKSNCIKKKSATLEGKSKEYSFDDVTTQMSTLGLSKRLDDELTPVLCRKNLSTLQNAKKVPACSFSHNKKIVKQISSAPAHRKTKKEDVAIRKRRIPIQIISDPFKTTGNPVCTRHRPNTVGHNKRHTYAIIKK